MTHYVWYVKLMVTQKRGGGFKNNLKLENIQTKMK